MFFTFFFVPGTLKKYLVPFSALNSPTSTRYFLPFYFLPCFLLSTSDPCTFTSCLHVYNFTSYTIQNIKPVSKNIILLYIPLFTVFDHIFNIPIFDKSLVEDHGWWVCIIGAASNVAVGCCTNISQQSFCFFTFLVASHVQ